MEENKINEIDQEATGKIHVLLLLKAISKRLLAVILIAITVMSCTFIATNLLYRPQYETKATFVASVKNAATSANSNLSAAKGAAESFSKVICSDAMKKQVANDLGVKRVAGTIEAYIVEETNILELRVTAATPQKAFRIITSIMNNYESMTDKVLNNVVLDVLQYPEIPTKPINDFSVERPVILSGIVAVAALIILICLFAYLRDTVKTPDEIEEKLDAKLIGTVQHERKYKTLKAKLRRKKKSILITDSTTGFGFVETFKKLRTKIDYAMRKGNYKVLMVSSVLEDEGKSTIAANIALAMKRKYKNVLLIDADMKKSAMHKIMEYNDKEFLTLNDVLDGIAGLNDAIVEDEETGLKLLLAKNCDEHSSDLANSERLKKVLSQAKNKMDIIVVDTPPMTAGPDTECIAEAVDAAVLVVRQNVAPVRIINDMIDVINASHAELLGCVFNDFSSADIDDALGYGQSRYGYGKYGYGKYGYGKYGYGKYGYGNYSKERSKHSTHKEEGM